MTRRQWGCTLLLITPILLLATLWLFREPLLTAAGDALIESDTPQKAQAIVVLGGDDHGCRIIRAAQLASAGYASFVIVSGPRWVVGHESDMTIQYARQKGYPASLFRPFPNESDSTRSETVLLGKYLKANGIYRIILVTSNYHTRRAALLMRRQNPWLQVGVVPAPDPFFTPDGWWKSRNGEKTFLLEWLKTIATWLGI